MKNLRKFFVLSLIALTIVCAGRAWSAPIDLSTFITENYVSLNGPQKWVVGGPGNSMVTQTTNGDPSIFRSGGTIDVGMKRITGEFLITGTDDDIVGFAFGYQNRGQMYLFGWKEQNQDIAQGTAVKGMYLSILDTGNPAIDPSYIDFFNVPSVPSNVRTILHENSLSWERNTTYSFFLDFHADQFTISILEGINVLESWSVEDPIFTSGDFGFFNASQPNVQYGNLEVNPVPVPATFPLFACALSLMGFIGLKRKKLMSHGRPH